jgi:hypothetical protein
MGRVSLHRTTRDEPAGWSTGIDRYERSDESAPVTAYLIAATNVHDAENYERYKELARPIAERYGGEYLARGGELRVDDGRRADW